MAKGIAGSLNAASDWLKTSTETARRSTEESSKSDYSNDKRYIVCVAVTGRKQTLAHFNY